MRALLAAITVALLAVAGAQSASGYPAQQKGADAAFRGIQAPSRMARGYTYYLSVDGVNRGSRGSRVDTSLTASKGATQDAGFRGARSSMFVRAHQGYRVIFKYFPQGRGKVRLRGCTQAVPRDVNRSNGCGSAQSTVFIPPRR